MKPRILHMLILSVLISSVLPVRSQAGQDQQVSHLLSPFQSVTGRLGAGLILDEWRFEGHSGELISLVAEKTSGDLDVVVTVLNPNAEIIAANDNATFDTTDARLEGLTLEVEGIYSVQVALEGGRFGTTAGQYQLTLLNGYSERDIDRRNSTIVDLPVEQALKRESLRALPATDFYFEFLADLPGGLNDYALEIRFRDVAGENHFWVFELTSQGEWRLSLQDKSGRKFGEIESSDPLLLHNEERVKFGFWQDSNTFLVSINHLLIAQLDAAIEDLPIEAGEVVIVLRSDRDHSDELVLTLQDIRLTQRFYTDDVITFGAIGPTQPGERIYQYKGTPQQIVDELRASEFIPTVAGGVQALATEAFIFTSDVGFSAYPMLGVNTYQNYVLGFTGALLEGATDTGCGAIFRQQDGANFATVLFTPLGQLYFLSYENGEAAAGGLAIESPALLTGLNQNNWFTIVVRDEQGSLFVNGRLVGEIALPRAPGTFAVHIVLSTPEQAYCRLQNVWLWTL